MKNHFANACKYEYLFWEMAYNLVSVDFALSEEVFYPSPFSPFANFILIKRSSSAAAITFTSLSKHADAS
jgi:hypothetical protein